MQKEVNFSTPHEFHSKIGLVFNSALGIPLLPFAYICLEIKNRAFVGVFTGSLTGMIIGYLIPCISGFLVLHGLQTFKRQLEEAKTQESLKHKLNFLYKAKKYYYLSVGLASVLMAVGLYLSTSGVIIVSYVILLFYMSFHLPLPKRYVKDLQLSGDEKEIILNDKDYQL